MLAKPLPPRLPAGCANPGKPLPALGAATEASSAVDLAVGVAASAITPAPEPGDGGLPQPRPPPRYATTAVEAVGDGAEEAVEHQKADGGTAKTASSPSWTA